MAVTETPPETVLAGSLSDPSPARPQPTGLAAVLGSGDHKVVGRLYIATSLLLGLLMVVLGGLFAVESTSAGTDVFTDATVYQYFTLLRVGTVFLVGIPVVIGVALVVVPLQVGARVVAFPRAAAASYWGWLVGAGLLVASYAMNGGPGGGSDSGVALWIVSLGLVVVALLLASVSLATTVLALRTPGLTLVRVPIYAWSVAVAAIMWILSLPVLLGLLVLMYVDHSHAGTGLGSNAELFGRIGWVLRNPQIYVLAVPVLGFTADVLATTAKARLGLRLIAQGAVASFGALGFGAFLMAADQATIEAPVTIAFALAAVLPVLALLALAADVFRRGRLALNAGLLYALTATLVLLVGVLAGALGSFPQMETTGTIYDIGVNHAAVLAAVMASLGGLHWWATKIGRQPANESIGRLAPLVLFAGALTIVIPDLVSGISGKGLEISPDWTGGIEGLNVIVVIGTAVLALGLLLALVSLAPIVRSADQVPRDPWEGQTLEWLTPSPPPLANFDTDLPVVRSAEPLVDQREEN